MNTNADRPQTPPNASTQTTHDQHLQIQTLREISLSHNQIRDQLNLSLR